jgi:hypothetical protein
VAAAAVRERVAARPELAEGNLSEHPGRSPQMLIVLTLPASASLTDPRSPGWFDCLEGGLNGDVLAQGARGLGC